MRKIINIPANSVVPTVDAIIELQGIHSYSQSAERARRLAEEALSVLNRLAFPIGIIMELSKEEFENVFASEGKNEPDSPVTDIYKSSDDLALFAVTIGENVCSEISRLFKTNEFPLGSMLDTVASEATELTAQAIENYYHSHLENIGRFDKQNGILRFSPGYCGWHVSGQKKLFRHLHPEDIGIKLRESSLMEPLKSISGVIISGKKEIFQFDDSFSFCAKCSAHECRERISAIYDK